jgi:hypothetical protein
MNHLNVAAIARALVAQGWKSVDFVEGPEGDELFYKATLASVFDGLTLIVGIAGGDRTQLYEQAWPITAEQVYGDLMDYFKTCRVDVSAIRYTGFGKDLLHELIKPIEGDDVE